MAQPIPPLCISPYYPAHKEKSSAAAASVINAVVIHPSAFETRPFALPFIT